MALDFPASPTNGQTYTGPGGVIWSWDGTKWVSGTAGTAYAPIASPVFTGNPQAPNPPDGDADTSVATTAFVAAAVAPALANTGRNLLHNSMFNVAQRGAGPWTTNGAYTADRWQLSLSLDTVSITQAAYSDAARAQTGDEAAAVALANTFTGNAGAAAFNRIVQKIENVRRLAGQAVTVSLWAAAGAGTPKLGIGFVQNFGTGGSPSGAVVVAGQSVTISTTYTRYSLTFAIPSASGKTLGAVGDHNTELSIWFSSGTTQAASAGNIGVQSGTVALWGVQLEIGAVATPLEKRTPHEELAECQRFYEVGRVKHYGWSGVASTVVGAAYEFKVTKRATPTVTLTNSGGASNVPASSTLDIILPEMLAVYRLSTAVGVTNYSDTFTASADL